MVDILIGHNPRVYRMSEDLFNKDEYLTEEGKGEKEYTKNFLFSVIAFVCIKPVTFIFGAVLGIIQRSLFATSNNGQTSKKDLLPSQKEIVGKEFKEFGNKLKDYGKESLTQKQIEALARKEYE